MEGQRPSGNGKAVGGEGLVLEGCGQLNGGGDFHVVVGKCKYAFVVVISGAPAKAQVGR